MCRHLCGLLTPPSETELAEAFVTTVPKRFEFWSGKVDLTNLGEDGSVGADTTTVRYPFRCTIAFDRNALVSYGDRDYSATVMLNGFRLEAWGQALASERLPDRRYLHTPDRIDEYMTAAAATVSRVWPQIDNPNPSLLGQVAEIAGDLPRHERLDEAQIAFAAKDYPRVVDLLTPLEANLFRSDARRLAKARKKTGEHRSVA